MNLGGSQRTGTFCPMPVSMNNTTCSVNATPNLRRHAASLGPLIADMVASNDLDFLCLTETHIHPFDSDSFL